MTFRFWAVHSACLATISGRRLETLPDIAQRDITLPDMAVGIYDWALIADHHLQRLTLVCHGDIQVRIRWLEQHTQPVNRLPFHLDAPWQANMSREEYGVKFRRIQEYIHSGDCYQINLAQRFATAYQGDEWQAFLRLNQANRAPFLGVSAVAGKRRAQPFSRTLYLAERPADPDATN